MVGVDCGESSGRAARRAAELAVQPGTEKVGADEIPQGPGTYTMTTGDLAEAIAAKFAFNFRASGPRATSSSLLGKPAPASWPRLRGLTPRLSPSATAVFKASAGSSAVSPQTSPRMHPAMSTS